jgi:glycosyltransferase involved in cell wall biosynthesis
MCAFYADKVLILTPLKNAESHLAEYFKLLLELTYPRSLISLGFLESDSVDNTYLELKKRLESLDSEFRSTGIWKKDFGFVIPTGVSRWATEIQIQRRSILARSRNHLLFRALRDEDWVLWIDVDLVGCPPNVIEQLLESGKDIVHPHCVRKSDRKTFDLNAWSDGGKRHMEDLRQEGDLVRLHAVGGSMLLVRADLHREGLVFPPFLFGTRSPLIRSNNHLRTNRDILSKYSLLDILRRRFQGEIETEGLGIMAYEMGHECWGMPNLEILHKG